jgi:hypothetical protein
LACLTLANRYGLNACTDEAVSPSVDVVRSLLFWRNPMRLRFLVWMFALLLAGPVNADPINLGFESGLDGWEVVRPIGNAVVALNAQGQLVFNAPAPAGEVVATDLLTFGLNTPLVSLDASTFALVGSKNGIFACCNQQFDIYATQSIFLTAGTIVTGWARFANGDFLMQDSAWVRVRDGSGTLVDTPWIEYSGSGGSGFPGSSGHLNSVPYLQATDWVQWEWQAHTDGLYELQMGVSTGGDADLASYGLYDNVRVPEPATGALTFLGLCITAVARRRRSPLV